MNRLGDIIESTEADAYLGADRRDAGIRSTVSSPRSRGEDQGEGKSRPSSTTLSKSPKQPKVKRDDPRIKKMEHWLAGKGWVFRAELFAAIGVSDRVGRKLKSLSRGRIISNSQDGYRLAAEATTDELKAAKQEHIDRRDAEQESADNIDRILQRRARNGEPEPLQLEGEPPGEPQPDNYFAPLSNPDDEARAQRVAAYDEIRRANTLRAWDEEYEKGQPFDVGTPAHTVAMRCRDLKLRVLRLIEQSGCSDASAKRRSCPEAA